MAVSGMTVSRKVVSGSLVRVLRLASGLTQAELGRASGYSRQMVCNVEAGRAGVGRTFAERAAAVIAGRVGAEVSDVRDILVGVSEVDD